MNTNKDENKPIGLNGDVGNPKNDETSDDDVVEIEDELFVEDSIGEEEGASEEPSADPAEEVPEPEELNWDDLELVDEIDSTEINNAEESHEKTELDLQKISDDEDETTRRHIAEDKSLRLAKKLVDVSAVSIEVGSSKKDEVVKHPVIIQFASADNVNDLSVADVKDSLSKSDNSDHAADVNVIENDVVDQLDFSVDEEECQVVDSLDVDDRNLHNISNIESDEDVGDTDDVLEIVAREDLQLNESENISFDSKSNKKLSDPPGHFENDKIKAASNVTDSDSEIQIVDEISAKTDSSEVFAANLKRREPLPSVALYVESLGHLVFDWKKYTCFFCVNNFRLKTAHDLLQSEIICKVSKHQQEIENCPDFIAGVEYVMEICDNDYVPRHWYCRLCNCVINSFDLLIVHLSSFSHIDNFAEKRFSNIYLPPGPSENDSHCCTIRVCSEAEEKRIVNHVKTDLKRSVGKLKSFKGTSLAEMNEEGVQNEEDLLASQIHQFFNDGKEYKVTSNFCSSAVSVANSEYKKMTIKQKDSCIGLQYLFEIWAPSRRVAPVWYCMLCDSLVNNWSQHCGVVQHIAAYLKKHYEKYAFDCSVLEANDEEELRNNFSIAKKNVLQLEGYNGRVNNVIQITRLEDFDSFVAINAIIAKNLVDLHHLKVADPPRAKRPSASQVLTKQTKPNSSVAKKEQMSSKQTNSKGKISDKPAAASRSPNKPRSSASEKSKLTKQQTKDVSAAKRPLKNTSARKNPSKNESTIQYLSNYAVLLQLANSSTSDAEKSQTVAAVEQNATSKTVSNKPSPAISKTSYAGKSKTELEKKASATGQSKSASASFQNTARMDKQKMSQSKISMTNSKRVDAFKNRRRPSPRQPSRRRRSRSYSRSPKSRRSEERRLSRLPPPIERRRSPPRRRPPPSSRPGRHVTPVRRGPPRSGTPYAQLTPRIRVPVRHSPSRSPRNHYSAPRRSNRSRSPLGYDRHDRQIPGRDDEEIMRRTPEIIDYEHRQMDMLDNNMLNAVLREASNAASSTGYPSAMPMMDEEPIIFLTEDNLAKFTELLRLAGYDIGRQITLNDLDGLRERFGSTLFDQFLNMVLTQPLSVVHQEQQHQRLSQQPVVPDLFSVNLSTDQQPQRRTLQSSPPRRQLSNVNNSAAEHYNGVQMQTKKRVVNRAPVKHRPMNAHDVATAQYTMRQNAEIMPPSQQQRSMQNMMDYLNDRNVQPVSTPNFGGLNLSVPPPPISNPKLQNSQVQSTSGYMNSGNYYGNSGQGESQSRPMYNQNLYEAQQTEGQVWPPSGGMPRNW